MAVLATKITKIDQDVVSALRVLVLDHVVLTQSCLCMPVSSVYGIF